MTAKPKNNSPLRKSQLFKRASLASRKNEDQNDDEAERAALLAEDKNQATSQFSTPKNVSTSSGLSANSISSPQKEHFQGCLKLYAENKINKDNAWNLQLIDFMSSMLRKHDSRMENLQMASTTLDASTRIYSFRVDAVHHDVLTMAGGLSKAAQVRRGKKPDGDEEERNDGDAEGADGDGNNKRKKKKKGAKNSISSNPEHQLNAEVEINECIDPFFAQLAATTGDMTSSNRAFNATLPIDDKTFGLILRSDVPFLQITKEGEKGPSQINTSAMFELKKNLFPYVKEDDQICVPFHGFSLTTWDPDDEEAKLKNEKWQETNLNLSQQAMAFDMNADVEPLPQDDHFACDNDDHGGVESDEEELGVMTHAIRPDKKRKVAHLVDMRPSAQSDAFLEYSYSGAVVGSWAGPAHWKLKNNINRMTRIGEKSQTLTKVTERKAPSRKKKDLNYLGDEGMGFSLASKNCPEYTAIASAKIAIGLKTLSLGATWNGKRLRIPIDKGYDLTHFRKFYLKQNVILKPQVEESEIEEKEVRLSDINDYDYNNDNDTSYCPNSQPNEDGGEWAGDEGNGEMIGGDVHNQNRSFEINGDLVEPPAKVAKTFIPYAMRAKKVDMKQLKQVTWKMLTFCEEGGDKENNPNGSEIEKVRETTFNNLYKKLPLKLSTSMKDCLSVPLSLLAVLHLANEKCLTLQNTSNYTDFTIIKE